jgi:hypothetical protein
MVQKQTAGGVFRFHQNTPPAPGKRTPSDHLRYQANTNGQKNAAFRLQKNIGGRDGFLVDKP